MGLKHLVFRLVGKDPEAVVVSFLSGPEPIARAMLDEVRRLIPDREHYAVTDLKLEGATCIAPGDARRTLRRKRIGLAPTLFTSDTQFNSLRWLAFRMAPTKVLAFNGALERHHLRLRALIASILFLRGVPLDRIFLRPSWLFPFKRDRSVWPSTHRVFEGRPLGDRPRIGVLSPYHPFPLSHGGAVRIYHMLREAAKDFDVFLFTFADKSQTPVGTPLLDFCAQVVVFPNPRYREPRWASILPPEVCEFRSAYVAGVLDSFRAQYGLRCMQAEYTQLATYNAEILVEHDVTFDLYQQTFDRERTLSARWNLWRWSRFERSALRQFKRIVAMSAKDSALLAVPHTRVIPNGVDIRRFAPELEPPGETLLFVGSFRHFPNVLAFDYLLDEIWPLIAARPKLRLVVIAGPDPHLYSNRPLPDPRVELHGFISDVRPFYAAANLVVVPTRVSAGTNLKVLEAMAAERAVVSTSSGCAGLGLTHARSVWIADTPAGFAANITALLDNDTLRRTTAIEARKHAVENYSWSHIGRLQKAMWGEVLSGVDVRPGVRTDVTALDRIQSESHMASRWEPASYFEFDVRVAVRKGQVCGFLVSRDIVGETEILNLAVALEARRSGVATALIESVPARTVFLEVRESNTAARNLYWKLGFRIVGRRSEYYENPTEDALVMRLSRSDGSATF